MTPEEVIQILEAVKDLTNDHGKSELGRAISSIRQWSAIPPDQPPQQTPIAGDRRAEERDPGEIEQHLAEDLGLTPKKRG